MKKVTQLTLILFFLFSIFVPSAFAWGGVYSTNYDASREEYALHFDTTGITRVDISLETSYGIVEQSETLLERSNGYIYLPSNGTYTFKFYSQDTLVGTKQIMATQVPNPSYTGEPGTGGVIYYFEYIPEDGGDTGGGDDGGTGGEPGGDTGGSDPTNSCDGCQLIRDFLECPEWDQYMSEWEAMISRAIPPPNWEDLAQTMQDTLVPPLIAATEDAANQISNQVQQSGNQITDQVDRTGKEIIDALGNAYYDGNSGLNQPTMETYRNSNVPNLADKDIPEMINERINENVPTFEVIDETETIEIPDPMAWQSPAKQSKPNPNQNIGTTARPTIPTTFKRTTTGSKSMIPSSDPAVRPPRSGETGSKNVIPSDWKRVSD